MLINHGGVGSINFAADILYIVTHEAEHYIDEGADQIPNIIANAATILRERAQELDKPFDEAAWSKNILDNSLKRFTGTTVRLEVEGEK